METPIKTLALSFIVGISFGWLLFHAPKGNHQKPHRQEIEAEDEPTHSATEVSHQNRPNPSPLESPKAPLTAEAEALKAAFDFSKCDSATASQSAAQSAADEKLLYPNLTFDRSGAVSSFTDPETNTTINDPEQIEALMNIPVDF